MSIKTIDRQIKGSAGVAKKINKGAERMVFDILQSTQYSMPIASTIRELATNACDSQREKEIAIEIIRGEKSKEDYYIERGGEQYEDSNFDRSYYDINSLNTDDNKIYLTYEERLGTGRCDVFKIRDNGVGIGGRRLEGILELGYSTKRNTSENFGAFGLGAKSALSTGAEFYTIETVHNGKKFKCNCYNYKTDFIIPAFNVKIGKQNPFITFSDGSKVYYEEVNQKNYTEVSFGTKKHNRNKFSDAIEEQLTYIDNVIYTIEDHEGSEMYSSTKNIHADVLHNSDNLIIADTYGYGKPHIVVVKNKAASTGINYGHIDFRELEMEDLQGPIAFKCPIRQVIVDDFGVETVIQDGVDVTPSREKVIWNESTKRYVQSVITAASEEATQIVQDELNSTDFLQWLLTCRSVISGGTSSSKVLGLLGKIIDKSMIKPTFPGDKRLRYHIPTKLFEGFSLTKLSSVMEQGATKIVRSDLVSWDGFDAKHVYFKDDVNFNKTTDAYLMNLNDRFNAKSVVVLGWEDLDAKFSKITTLSGDAKLKMIKEKGRVTAKRAATMKALKESAMYNVYDDVIVPEEWLEDYKEAREEEENIAASNGLSAADRREIEKRMVAYTLRLDDKRNDDKSYTWDKIEPKAKDLMLSDKRTYYGTKADEELLLLAAAFINPMAPMHSEVFPGSGYNLHHEVYKEPVFFYERAPVRHSTHYVDKKLHNWAENPVTTWDTPQLIRVSEDKVRHIKTNANCRHISEFFLQTTPNGGYTMDKTLIDWFTAEKLENIKDYDFMYGMKDIHPDLKADYDKLQELRDNGYTYRDYTHIQKSDAYKHVQKIIDFQLYARDESDPALLAAKSKELFVLSDIGECTALSLDIIDMYANLKEFADDVKPLLSFIERLERDENMNADLEKELRVYLRAKNRETWETITHE